MIDGQVAERTMKALGCRRSQYYNLVNAVRKQYGSTISREDAAYVLAADSNVDLVRLLDRETRDRVREIRSNPPAPAPVVTTRRARPASSGSSRRSEATESATSAASVHKPCRRQPRDLIDCVGLHPQVAEVARGRFLDGHYADAVEQAIKLFNNMVKVRAGHPKDPTGAELDGASLMTRVFSRENPIIRLNSLRSDSQRNEQLGYMKIAEGAWIGVRSPRAHEHNYKDRPERALELLVLASHLMWRLDKASRVRARRVAPPVP